MMLMLLIFQTSAFAGSLQAVVIQVDLPKQRFKIIRGDIADKAASAY